MGELVGTVQQVCTHWALSHGLREHLQDNDGTIPLPPAAPHTVDLSQGSRVPAIFPFSTLTQNSTMFQHHVCTLPASCKALLASSLGLSYMWLCLLCLQIVFEVSDLQERKIRAIVMGAD